METTKAEDAAEHEENDEFERRWLVFEIDKTVFDGPFRRIRQGYLDDASDLRVRVIDGTSAELTCKVGRGMTRKEKSPKDPVSVGIGRFLLGSTPYVLTKRRFKREGWEIDRFEGVLQGIVLAEFEAPTVEAAQVITLPSWITNAIEVTETITNKQLARLAADLAEGETLTHAQLIGRIPSVVLTGCPCSGKTSLMRRYLTPENGEPDVTTLGRYIHCIPEVATIVIGQVGAHPPLDDVSQNRKFQRNIYRVQRSFEAVSQLHASRTGKHVLLLDRGTMDGAAYVDGGVPAFEKAIRKQSADEYARYDAVLIMAPPPREVYEREQKKETNKSRFETYEQALALHERIVDAWKGHPRAVVVDGATWEEKAALAERLITNAFMRS